MAVKLEGFRELEAALAELPKATGRNVLRRVARGALEPMAERARASAPVGEGDLRESIIVSERRTSRAKQQHRFNNKTGLEMAMGPASGTGTLYYATHAEFGTVDTAAVPYMRPAWDRGAHPALDYIKDSLAKEISKAAARLARKRSRVK